MIRYIKCPRCDLNYIDADKQEYCDVCIAEMKGSKLQFADLEDDEEAEIDAELAEDAICPVCGVNPIRYGESMCESCMQKQEYEEEEDMDIDKDEEWKNYLDEDDTDLSVEDTELDEELKAELEEEDAKEDDEMYHGEDDDFFESEDVDPLDDLEDDDFDDDDDDDDDDDF